MILDAIISQFFSLAEFVVSLFPLSSGFPAEFHNAAILIGGHLQLLDAFVSVSVLVSCLTTLLTVEIAIFTVKIIMWLLSFLPGFNTSK